MFRSIDIYRSRMLHSHVICRIFLLLKYTYFILVLVQKVVYKIYKLKTKLNSVAFSPQANYTDRATAACRRSYCQLLRIEGVAWSAQRIQPRPLISVFKTGAATFPFK
jgi:hypothetical protein